MTVNSEIKPSICACSKEAVAFKLYKEIRHHGIRKDNQQLPPSDPKTKMANDLQIYLACLMATQGIEVDIIKDTLPDV